MVVFTLRLQSAYYRLSYNYTSTMFLWTCFTTQRFSIRIVNNLIKNSINYFFFNKMCLLYYNEISQINYIKKWFNNAQVSSNNLLFQSYYIYVLSIKNIFSECISEFPKCLVSASGNISHSAHVRPVNVASYMHSTPCTSRG